MLAYRQHQTLLSATLSVNTVRGKDLMQYSLPAFIVVKNVFIVVNGNNQEQSQNVLKTQSKFHHVCFL